VVVHPYFWRAAKVSERALRDSGRHAHGHGIAAAASGRNNRKRKRIQKEGTLTQEEADDIKAQREALMLAKEQEREERRVAGGSSRGIPHCRTCGEL
jgi:hypothetical protein